MFCCEKKCLCWLWLKVKLQWYGILKKILPHVAKIKPRDFSTNRHDRDRGCLMPFSI